jgi:hypothetical protein
MDTLIIHRGEGRWTPEGHQIAGFRMYERELRSSLGMACEFARADTLEDVEALLLERPVDLAFVMLSWEEPAERVVETFARIRARGVSAKICFLDYYASCSSPHFGVLPHVDLYLKRQAYRDRSDYLRDYQGGNAFVDHLAREMDYELDGWHFGSRPDPAHLHKIQPAWNLGVASVYRNMLKITGAVPVPWEFRPFALNRRIGLGLPATRGLAWYHRYRAESVQAVEPLAATERCTGLGRLRRAGYLAELTLSKIGFSPFGWGEVCFRDYEIVCSGSLLLKPSMDHLATAPDIYVAGKTYAPVAWDLSDVVDVCRHYLAHPNEAREIIHNARVALESYFEQGGFVGQINGVLERLRLHPEPALVREEASPSRLGLAAGWR